MSNTLSSTALEPDRFAFGANWRSFSALIDEERLEAARTSLTIPLGLDSLRGKTFLDIGCGSGLFSAAAYRLGATVTSFDYDADAVGTTDRLRQQLAADGGWTVQRGSILDRGFVAALGRFDVVYAWGVLHHTGAMWDAIEAASDMVARNGLLFLSIYNDQGMQSRIWRRVKRRYVRSGRLGKWLLLRAGAVYFGSRRAAASLLARRRPAPRPRGMSASHDLVDWIGGYPFEVARPDEIFGALHRAGFQLRYLKSATLGCNEFVFERTPVADEPR